MCKTITQFCNIFGKQCLTVVLFGLSEIKSLTYIYKEAIYFFNGQLKHSLVNRSNIVKLLILID